MTIDKNKIRKEVHLVEGILNELQKQADTEGRSLKNLMEYILTQHVLKQLPTKK